MTMIQAQVQKTQAQTSQDLLEELNRLRSENQSLKQQSTDSLKFKISEKGALSVYGLGRFPVTLYLSQWLRLLAAAEALRSFIKIHEAELAVKQ